MVIVNTRLEIFCGCMLSLDEWAQLVLDSEEESEQ